MQKFLEALIIFLSSLIPSIVTLLLLRRAEEKARASILAARERATRRYFRELARSLDPDHIPGAGRMIGDISCQFNARSAHIRCAVNPSGPCEGCSHYQPKEEKKAIRGFY